MPDQNRAWKRLKSFQLALTIGGLAGLIVVGLGYLKIMGDLDPTGALLAGAAVMVGLTLVLTYVLDQISKSVSSFVGAVKGKGRGGGSKGEPPANQ